MIRIDEIYYNVFVRALQHKSDIICHWFDPFGSTRFQDMCVHPATIWPDPISLRLIFWDQEPVWLETSRAFMDQFQERYCYESADRIIITSEKNSQDLEWLCDTYGIRSQHYFFHGWAALDWYRGYDHSFLIKPWSQRNLSHPLFIPNNIIGGRRIHRLKLLTELEKRQAVKMNLISFPDVCPYEKISAHDLAKSTGLDIGAVELPLIIDSNSNHADHSNKINFWDQAQHAFCHVVTETVWGDKIHLTEKIFKPIVMQQPFILVGSKNGLEYLRSYGFKTFNHIWDESYDTLDGPQRMTAIADLCAEISAWSHNEISQAQESCANILEHNQKWFYGGFQDVLWKELTEMIQAWQ